MPQKSHRPDVFHIRVFFVCFPGTGTLERADLADAINTEARQRLQDVVQRSRPAEKLRYSTLLLALHTLFGIHCGMLQALLFRPLPNAATFDEFVWRAMTSAGVDAAAATAASSSS